MVGDQAPGGTLRVSRVHFPVTTLGYGTRLGIWVQGCPLACPGCMSVDTWAADAGTEVSVAELAGLWREAVAAGASGVTISGGEPLEQLGGLGSLIEAIAQVRADLTDEYGLTWQLPHRELDILLYTGYEPAEFSPAQRQVVGRADAVITGRFKIGAPTALIWRGSANQQLTWYTDLGRRRYAPMADHAPARAPMQVIQADGNVWLIGVPRVGDLPRFETSLARRGLRPSSVSWRRGPSRPS
jgi:anaerobic ribonucleoside-triphosphate reductase activating protein